MAKRNKSREPVDRAAEYIDSPLMTQRLHHKNRLSVRITGNYGTYRTQLGIGKKHDFSCT